MNEPEESPPRSPDEETPAQTHAEEVHAGVANLDSDAASAAAQASSEEGLPEWEPLTPELVEDEAIRGDFMLRWAVVLLALLMGWTVIQETEVLTHIKSGEVLAANGFLPSGKDALSSTAGETPWLHLAWLFDLLVAGIHGALGASGLTMLKALLAALVFWLLSRISLPGVPTWWGSVCAAIALVAAFPSLVATPAIITLLGMALLLWLLNREAQQSDSGFCWPILVLMIVWNQLDDRAWIGVVALLAYAIGDYIDRRAEAGTEGRRATGTLLPVAGLSLAAMIVHPMGWKTWLSGQQLYQLEYPTRQIYAGKSVGNHFAFLDYPLWSEEFWTIGYFNGAALLLWVVTLIVLVMNWTRARTSHLVLFAAMSVIGAAGGSELAVASIVNAVLATLNAQQWYRENFRQTYSIETGELLFSRGGRALTVVAFFALGFVMVAGHLTGAAGRRIGTGFDAGLAQIIGSYRDVLSDAYDDRPFNFVPWQGDVLNWVGGRPFVDSRLALFATGVPSIVDEHLKARSALRIPPDGSFPDRQVWQEVFDRYDIHQVLPRMSGSSPDYTTFRDLLRSPDWEMTSLTADAALFARTDGIDAELAAYRQSHSAENMVQNQLRARDEELAVTELRTTYPQPPSVYSQYFYQPAPAASPELQRARHYLSLSEAYAGVDQVIAGLYATLREVHRGLAVAPNDDAAYLVAGQAYEMLWQIERSVMQGAGMEYPGTIRFIQTITANRNALACAPQNAVPHFQLFRAYFDQQYPDLALHHLEEFQRLNGRLTLLPEEHADHATEQQQMTDLLTSLKTQVDNVAAKADEDLAAGMDRLKLVEGLANARYTLTALKIFDADLTVLSGKPVEALLYARLLLEAGRTRDANIQLEGLRALGEQGQLPYWAYYASLGQMAAEELPAAISTLDDEYSQLAGSSAMLMMQQSPLRGGSLTDPTSPVDPLVPVSRQVQAAEVYLAQIQPRMEDNMFRRALLHLELGQNAEAAELLQSLLDSNPGSSFRPLTEMYLSLLVESPTIPPLPEADEASQMLPDLLEEPSAEKADDAAAAEKGASLDDSADDEPAAPDAPTTEAPESDGDNNIEQKSGEGSTE